MAMEHVNRKGDTYYLQQGTTKTGKPRYYFGRKLKAAPLDALPEGYEVYESPETGQVYARKAVPTEISPAERRMVEEAVATQAGLKHAIVDVQRNSLVVYLPGTNADALGGLTETLGVPQSVVAKLRDELTRRAYYEKMLRFDLVDAAGRWYVAQRWCFLGSIEDWIFLDGPAPLADLLDKFAKHLGKESFYELI